MPIDEVGSVDQFLCAKNTIRNTLRNFYSRVERLRYIYRRVVLMSGSKGIWYGVKDG